MDSTMQQAAPTSPPPSGGETAMTPQEQQQIKQAMGQISQWLFEDKNTRQSSLKMIRQGDPAKACGQVAALLTQRYDESVNGEVPEDLVVPIAREALEMTLDFAEDLKLVRVDDAAINKALQSMMGELYSAYGDDRENVTGMLEQPEVMQQVKQFGQMNQPQGQGQMPAQSQGGAA